QTPRGCERHFREDRTGLKICSIPEPTPCIALFVRSSPRYTRAALRLRDECQVSFGVAQIRDRTDPASAEHLRVNLLCGQVLAQSAVLSTPRPFVPLCREYYQEIHEHQHRWDSRRWHVCTLLPLLPNPSPPILSLPQPGAHPRNLVQALKLW